MDFKLFEWTLQKSLFKKITPSDREKNKYSKIVYEQIVSDVYVTKWVGYSFFDDKKFQR